MNTRRRTACLIVEAAPGFRGAANGLIRRAIKRAGLAVESFVPIGEAKSYGLPDARFTVDCTDEELTRLREVGDDLARADGWERFPVDIYHD